MSMKTLLGVYLFLSESVFKAIIVLVQIKKIKKNPKTIEI